MAPAQARPRGRRKQGGGQPVQLELDDAVLEDSPTAEPWREVNVDEIDDAPVEEEKEGLTPSLEVAAWKGKLDDVRHYLRVGADPNAMVTEEEDTQLHHTPLMAAAASDSMDAVVELLLAGADPDLPSPVGVVAADLASNRGVMKILALFSSEVELEAKQAALASPDADAEEIRRNAVAALRCRALDVLKRVLLPGSLAKFTQSAEPPVPAPSPTPAASPPPESEAAQEPSATGLSAREARKQRQEAAERERLRKVAEKAAARRSEDQEEIQRQKELERLNAIAEKAAQRREMDPEEARAMKISQKAALKRQVSLNNALYGRAKSGEDLSASNALAPAAKRKRVEKEAEVRQCGNCGHSGVPLECGMCGCMGMCSVCSKCYLCGQISGFCQKPEVHARPGMHGMIGMPAMSGVSHEDLAAMTGTGAPGSPKGKKKKKRKKKGGSSDSTSGGLAVVEAPKASPKEAEDSEDETKYGLYFVDNKEHKAPSAGMAFRLSKNLTDVLRDMRKFAAWGTTVAGWDQGDGWLKVGEFYLPFHLSGQRVLTFKASAEDAKLAVPKSKKKQQAPEKSPEQDED